MPRKIAAGNWKMNGLSADLDQIEALYERVGSQQCSVIFCPPVTLLSDFSAQAACFGYETGGQHCHSAQSGAYTGDISAQMLQDAGARYVILGHSERRMAHGETDQEVAQCVAAAQKVGLTPIVCLGESLEDRAAGTTLSVIGAQLAGSLPEGVDASNLVIAYEPIWAIGTGKIPSHQEIEDVHGFLRSELRTRFGPLAEEISLLYGGSVKPENAAEIFAISNVDGGLIGGASMDTDAFAAIIRALDARS